MEPGCVIPLSNLRVIGRDIAFQEENHSILIRTAGTYLFIWHIVADSPCTQALLISLEDPEEHTVHAYSAADGLALKSASTISGSTAVQLEAGAQVILRNRSSSALTMKVLRGGSGHRYSNSLTVVRIG